MTQEADFCGDRLRLSAFLRVVADGMPQRPTRFKRRSRGIDHRLGSSGQHDTDHVDARSSPAQKAAHEQCHNNTSILDVVRSPSPQLPELAAEDFRSVTRAKSGSQKDREQSEDVQPSENQRQTGERTSVTAVTKSLKKPRKIPSTRKRRHLPVNGLALLRSTSSDGLPLPSDADHVFAAPVAALDPIDDSQIRSVTPSKILPGRPRGHRVEKPSLATGSKPSSPAWLLRGRFVHLPLARSNGTHSSTSSRHSFAIGSDGFVGAELDIQHATKQNKPRASNRTRTKNSVRSNGRLVLACGYLPPPPIEYQDGGVAMAEQRLHTTDFQAVETPNRAGEPLPLSQRAVTEIHKVTKEKEAKERRQSRVRQHDSLVRSQLSNVTAPSRHTSENSSSGSADEEVTLSCRSSDDFDKSHEQVTSQGPYAPSTRRAHNHLEAERYFERAMRDLDAAGRSDSVNGEFWSQYGGLERSDGH